MASVYSEFSQVKYALNAQKLKDKEKWQFKRLKGSLNVLQSMSKKVAKWNHLSAVRREAIGQ